MDDAVAVIRLRGIFRMLPADLRRERVAASPKIRWFRTTESLVFSARGISPRRRPVT